MRIDWYDSSTIQRTQISDSNRHTNFENNRMESEKSDRLSLFSDSAVARTVYFRCTKRIYSARSIDSCNGKLVRPYFKIDYPGHCGIKKKAILIAFFLIPLPRGQAISDVLYGFPALDRDIYGMPNK